MKKTNSSQWYRKLKQLTKHDQQDDLIQVESIKFRSDEEQVELIADKFSKVSQEYSPLDRSKIVVPPFNQTRETWKGFRNQQLK